MSLLNKVLGNAVQADPAKYNQELATILLSNEQVTTAYELIRDRIIFTNERLILINVQGITGSKTSYTSYPYSSIKVYSMENAGTLDTDCEIKLYVQGITEPVSLSFKKGTDLNPIYRNLSEYILRDN
jgi:Bacterial PH domain